MKIQYVFGNPKKNVARSKKHATIKKERRGGLRSSCSKRGNIAYSSIANSVRKHAKRNPASGGLRRLSGRFSSPLKLSGNVITRGRKRHKIKRKLDEKPKKRVGLQLIEGGNVARKRKRSKAKAKKTKKRKHTKVRKHKRRVKRNRNPKRKKHVKRHAKRRKKHVKRHAKRRVKRSKKTVKRHRRRTKRSKRSARTIRRKKALILQVAANPKRRRQKRKRYIKFSLKRLNPFGGSMDFIKKFESKVGIPLVELGGLAAGGALYGTVNRLFLKIPFLKDQWAKALNIAYIGQVLVPALPNLAAGIAAAWIGRKKRIDMLTHLGQGLIGSAVVGIGVSAGQIITSKVAGAPVAGVDFFPNGVQSDFGRVDYTPSQMGGVRFTQNGRQSDFGLIPQGLAGADFGLIPSGMGEGQMG